MSDIEFNDKELKKLIKQYSENMPSIKVGILGDKTIRAETSATNAGIGAVHEFGSLDGKIPMRSFLRMPIEEKLYSEIELIDMKKGSSIREIAYEIGVAAVDVITMAFATGGFGKWKKGKKGQDTLIDTGQLQASINFEIEQ